MQCAFVSGLCLMSSFISGYLMRCNYINTGAQDKHHSLIRAVQPLDPKEEGRLPNQYRRVVL
jgi:hypothetical protein